VRYIHAQQNDQHGEGVNTMSEGTTPRIETSAVNWIVRRVGVGIALAAAIALVIAIVLGFYGAKHGMPLGSGMIWTKN
jgi:hypothetical protein